MRNVERRILLPALVAGLLLGAGSAAAQGPVVPVPTVRLASPQTPPGGETFVTVMLENDPAQPVQVLKTEVEFQANHLTYVTSRLGFAGELAGATLDVKVVPVEPTAPAGPAGAPPNPASRPRTRIALVITGKKVIPNGPVAELRFKVGPAFQASAGGVTDADHQPPGTAKPGEKPATPPAGAKPVPLPPAGGSPTLEKPADGTSNVVAAGARVVIIKVGNKSEGSSPQGANVPLIAEAGEVRVTTERKGAVPMVFACFFYMH